MLDLVIALVLAAHLLCVNAAAGAPLLAAWLDWRWARTDDTAAYAVVRLARAALAGLLAGALLGIAVGWLRWDTKYQQLWLGPLSYKLHRAILEAVFSLVLLVGWWLSLPGRAGGRAAWALVARCVVAVLAATNLLYHFPPLFSVAIHLQQRGDFGVERIGGAEFRRLMSEGPTAPLAVHAGLASIAVAGVVLMLSGFKRPHDEAAAARLARCGGLWALWPTLLQLPVGLWTLISLPADMQSALLGNSTIGLLLFIAAIGAALWLANDLVHITMGEPSRALIIRAALAMILTVVLMTLMQHHARRGTGQALVPSPSPPVELTSWPQSPPQVPHVT